MEKRRKELEKGKMPMGQQRRKVNLGKCANSDQNFSIAAESNQGLSESSACSAHLRRPTTKVWKLLHALLVYDALLQKFWKLLHDLLVYDAPLQKFWRQHYWNCPHPVSLKMMLASCVARMTLQIVMVSQLTGFLVETAIGGYHMCCLDSSVDDSFVCHLCED